MDFITEDVQKTLNLTPEQIEGLKPLVSNHIADLQKNWDGKANENAERILDGAASKVADVTKVSRNQGEKVADYIERASNTHLSSLKTNLENARQEYEQKVKDFKGDEATKAELQKAKEELDNAKKQLADFDTYKAKAEKLEPLQNEYLSMKKQIAYQGVKPTFPDTVNPYEAKAKWDEFVKDVEEKYEIELVDGEAIAKDKSNEYKTIKLKDLLAQNKNISDLMQGRKQSGTGAQQKDNQTIEGVPFAVPLNATSEERAVAIRNYLAEIGLKATSSDYPKQFAKYNQLILKAKR